MRLCIIGSRSITDPLFVFQSIEKFVREHCVGQPTFISGGAKGVDSLTKRYANDKGYDFVEFLPYHLVDKEVEYNSRYFFARNRQMIQNADKVLALWDEESTGTLHAIRYSQKMGVPVMVIKHPVK